MNTEIYREGRLDNGLSYSVAGRSHNGEAYSTNSKIDVIGEDVSLVIPNRNVVAVFDGAGGTKDVGSPLRAAIRAADATEMYFRRGGEDPDAAMRYAGEAVQYDPFSGVAVGSIARFTENRIKIATAGDTSALVFDTVHQDIPSIARQQVDLNGPTNYLGRRGRWMPERIEPSSEDIQYDQTKDEVYLMSDGAYGSWQSITNLEDYNFSAAHNEYLLLQAAIDNHPELEDLVINELSGVRAGQLRERQIKDGTNGFGDVVGPVSPELSSPSSFSIEGFDWDIWEEIVKPVILRLNVQSKISSRAITAALLDRRIDQISSHRKPDDATLILVNPIINN